MLRITAWVKHVEWRLWNWDPENLNGLKTLNSTVGELLPLWSSYVNLGIALSLFYLTILALSLTRQWASWDQNPHLNICPAAYFYSSSTYKVWHKEGSKSVWYFIISFLPPFAWYLVKYLDYFRIKSIVNNHKWKLKGLDFLTIGSYYFCVATIISRYGVPSGSPLSKKT